MLGSLPILFYYLFVVSQLLKLEITCSDFTMYLAVLKGYWNLPNPFPLKQFSHKLASSATANGRHLPGIRMT